MKIIEPSELLPKHNKHYGALYTTLTVPSIMNTFTLSVGYMKDWFMNKFAKDFFKATNVDESHMMKAFDRAKINQNLKIMKPSLFISPRINMEFDRENIDLNMYGLNRRVTRSQIDHSFFQDREKNMYLSVALESCEMTFGFKIRLSSRSIQLDIANYMNKAFAIGTTQGKYTDLDFHIPYSTVLTIAKDAGFTVTSKGIENLPEFMRYLNSHSSQPILYKFTPLTGHHDFFVRLQNFYIHLDCKDRLSLDDGEQEGQLMSNYMIDMNVTMHIGMPKVYAYYSSNKHNDIEIETRDESNTALYSLLVPNIEDYNSKGWDNYLQTTVFEEDRSKPLEIEFEDLFKGGDVGRLIEYNNSIYVSSSSFIEIKLFNNAKEIDYTIDWKNQKIVTKNRVEDENTTMVVYVDRSYVNQQIITLDALYGDKLRDSKNQR